MEKGGIGVRKYLLLIMSALALMAAGTPAFAIQCVPYARELSGINLKGDAWQWWNAASGVYDRGRTPKDGAVLVFTRQGSMRYGHVSVVTRVISSRLALVDHANWAPARTSGRGAVTTAVPVLDVSPKNDWTQVRVWFHPASDFGNRIYRTDGYVYQPRDPRLSRPAVHQVALNRAAQMFPSDRALARQAVQPKPLETSRTEAAAPRVDAIAAEAAVKATIAIVPTAPAVQAEMQAAPSAEGLVKVAKHVFRPKHPSAAPASLDSLLFN
ncbi:MAG: CHAP domain-containing protein [Rhodospirillaceae bacterium]|nr:CHAP domain-containing protein [Rhodospirillales bacterium]